MCVLSIIIPAYNASSDIQKCIDSIADSLSISDFKTTEIEVIVINDGSTDNTLEILETLCFKYSFLKVESQNNCGVSKARNKGLGLSTGKYVQFVDADDSISLLYFSEISSLIESEYYLLVYGFNSQSHKKIKEYIYKGQDSELLENYLKGKARINIWSCLFRRDLIERWQLRFDESTYYGEDREFLVKALLLSISTFYIPRSLYNYNLLNMSSAMNSSYSAKRLTSIEADLRLLQFAIAHNCSDVIIRLLKNQVLSNFYINKRLVDSSDDPQAIEGLGNYLYLQQEFPPFQLTKFWLYSFCSWLLCKIKWI